MMTTTTELTEKQFAIGERLQRLVNVRGVRDAMSKAVHAWLAGDSTASPRPIDFNGPIDELVVLAAAAEAFSADANIKPVAFELEDFREARWGLLVGIIRRWKDNDERFGHLRKIIDEAEMEYGTGDRSRGRRGDRLEAIEKVRHVLAGLIAEEKARRNFAAKQGRTPDSRPPITQKQLAELANITETRLSHLLHDREGGSTREMLEGLKVYRTTGQQFELAGA
jgi:hypothetical protein